VNADSVVGKPLSEEGRRNYDRIFGKKFDVFLPCAPKDYNKLPFVIDAIRRNLDGFNEIWICSPVLGGPHKLCEEVLVGPHYCEDLTVLPCDRSKWKYRPNWNFQQHLKLFQKVTSDWYITLDCDTIINRTIKFWQDEKPIWYKGWDQTYAPYFEFNKKILGIERIETKTFIADMNFFYRPFVNEMLAKGGYTVESFIETSQKITTEKCHMAEPELYGQYVLRYHPNYYHFENLKQKTKGKYQRSIEAQTWAEADIRAEIEENRGKDYDTFSLHSWLTKEAE
jgi:hypothetical protein